MGVAADRTYPGTLPCGARRHDAGRGSAAPWALALPDSAGDSLAAWAALARFLDVPTIGLWREQWDPATATFLAKPAPASSLYHITTAVMELRRYADRASA
jgi:hypothetical protein